MISQTREFQEILSPEDGVSASDYNSMVKDLNSLVRNFPVSGLNGQLVEVILPASAEVRISHSLKIIPKYRLILGQTGNSVITDVKEKWTRDYITLKNNAAVEVFLILMIIRE